MPEPDILGGPTSSGKSIDQILAAKPARDLGVTTSAFVGASVNDILFGPGTTSQAVREAQVESELQRDVDRGLLGEAAVGAVSPFVSDERRGTPITKQQFNERIKNLSEPVKSKLSYRQGMTDEAFRIEKGNATRDARLNELSRRATLGQQGLGLVSSLPAGAIEPMNLTAAIATRGASILGSRAFTTSRKAAEVVDRADKVSGAVGKTRRVQRQIEAIKRRDRFASVASNPKAPPSLKKQLAIAGGEGVVSGGLIAGAGADIAQNSATDYTYGDAALEVFIGGSLSVLLQTGGGLISRVAKRKSVSSQVDKARSMMALEQAKRGETVDTTALDASILARVRTPQTSLVREQIDNPDIIETEDGFFAFQPEEEEFMTGALGRGSTAEEARDDLIRQYDRPDEKELMDEQMNEGFFDVVRKADELNEKVRNFNEIDEAVNILRNEGASDATLESDFSQFSRLRSELEQENNRLAVNRSRAEQRQSLDSEARSLKGRLGTIEKEVKDLRRGPLRNVGELDKEIENIRSLIEDLKVRKAKFEEEAKAKYRDAETEIKRQAGRLGNLRDEDARAEARQKLEEAKAAKREALAEEQRGTPEIDRQIASERGRLRNKQRQLKTENSNVAPELQRLNELENHREEIEEKRAEIAARRDSITVENEAPITQRIDSLKGKLGNVKKRINNKRRQDPSIDDALTRAVQRKRDLDRQKKQFEDLQIRMQEQYADNKLRETTNRGAGNALGVSPDDPRIQAMPLEEAKLAASRVSKFEELTQEDIRGGREPSSTEARDIMDTMLENREQQLNDQDAQALENQRDEIDTHRSMARALQQYWDCIRK